MDDYARGPGGPWVGAIDGFHRRWEMHRKVLALAMVLGVTMAFSTANAQERRVRVKDEGQSALDTNERLLDPAHHGPATGHLPPDVENVDLVSRLRLTDKTDGIADVGYFKGYAYLNAWFPNCPERGGSGGGVHVVVVRNPASPTKGGVLPSGPNPVPRAGVHGM
jgi:hypothetical protein